MVNYFNSCLAIFSLILVMSPCKADELDVSGEIIDVLQSSDYCTYLDRSSRCICDYATTNKTIRLASQFETKSLELSILNAASFIYHPLCSVSWVTVYNSSNVITLPDMHKDERKSCTVLMKIVNSTVDTLAYGIHDIYIEDSTVQIINLKNQKDVQLTRCHVDHIEWLQWEGYNGRIDNSSISKISHLFTKENLIVSNSKFGTIAMESVTIAEGILTLSISKIGNIGTNGISIIGGVLVMQDVVIENLESFAIVVDSTTKVAMKNVRILNGKSPIFLFPSSQNVELENVTVGGTQIRYNSEWISETEKKVKHEKVSKAMKQCHSHGSSLDCNFQGFSQDSSIDVKHIADVSSITLRNANKLTINNNYCQFKRVLIINSNVTQISGTLNNASLCDSALKIQNSTVKSIATSTFSSVEFQKSLVSHFESENIKFFEIQNSTIDVIKFLLTTINSKGILRNSFVGTVVDANINGPIEIENSSIDVIKSFIIDHRGKTSKFNNVKLQNIDYRGLRVNYGHLSMVRVSFSNLFHQSIFLETGGTLSIQNSVPIPSTGRGFISILRKEQVKIHVPIVMLDESWYYSIRSTDETIPSKPKPDEIRVNGTFLPSPFCHAMTSTVLCDFGELASAAVDVNFASSEPYAVALDNINFLTLHPICSAKVSLLRISNGTIMKSEPCPLSMQIDESYLMEIFCGMQELAVRLSNIKHFMPNTPIQSAIMESSVINVTDSFTCVKSCHVQNTVMNIVEEVVVFGNLLFRDGHINLVKPQAITIKGGRSQITRSKISKIRYKGFTIYGELLIANTTIELAEDMSFDIYGVLNLENVIIKNGSAQVFNIRHRGSVRYKNVNINGKFLKISQSIIFLKEDEHIQHSVSIEHSRANDVHFTSVTRNEYFKSLKSSIDSENSSLGVTILGFIVGAICSAVTMYAITIYRSKLNGAMKSAKRWNSLVDDEPELVSNFDDDERELQLISN